MKPIPHTLFLSCLLLTPAFALDAEAGDMQGTAQSPAQTQINMRQAGNILTVEGSLATPINRATAWSVLTDYTRFPEFVPGIFSNRVLEQRNELKMIEQRGMIVNKQFQMPYQGIMQVEETKRDGAAHGLKILFLSGPLKDVQGEWNIQPGKPLGLTYSLRMDLTKTPFPPPMATSIVEQQVRTWVDAFSREMQVVKRIKE